VSTLLALAAVVVALAIGYAIGRARRKDAVATATAPRDAPPRIPASPSETSPPAPAAAASVPQAAPPTAAASSSESLVAERARIVRSFEGETALLRRALVTRDAAINRLAELADERRRLFGELATARAETARYRQFVVDLENNAPPLLFGTGAPDDLKLIVGVGPVLERMLHQLGVGTYRQIAHWSERDIDEFDAKLHEFPGRIRRDAWVTQARALHQSKYGETLPARAR